MKNYIIKLSTTIIISLIITYLITEYNYAGALFGIKWFILTLTGLHLAFVGFYINKNLIYLWSPGDYDVIEKTSKLLDNNTAYAVTMLIMCGFVFICGFKEWILVTNFFLIMLIISNIILIYHDYLCYKIIKLYS